VLRLVAFLAFLIVGSASVAQSPIDAEIDYSAWSEAAQLAEASVSASRTSISWLEAQRSRLADWRARFLEEQTVNQSRITTITQQIEALGSPPDDGSAEDPAIAARRSELQEQLSQLRAPQLRAEEAFKQADGLIAEIDLVIRNRQTQALLSADASPLNPSTWAAAQSELAGVRRGITTEIQTGLQSPAQREQIRQEGPIALVFVAVAILLLFRGRNWLRQATKRYVASGFGLSRFLVSLGDIILPGIGLLALSEAAYASGLVGALGEVLIDASLSAGLVFLTARWIAGQVLPRNDAPSLLRVPDGSKGLGRWLIAATGVIMALFVVVQDLADFSRWSSEVRGTILFPIIVVLAWQLFRIRGLLRLHLKGLSEAGEDQGIRDTLINALSFALIAVSVFAPLLAALGYGAGAEALLQPTVISLALLAILWVLQQQIFNLYAWVSRRGDDARDALLPVMAGFVLVILSMPLFALIWGARTADLTELWAQFLEGVQLGETQISPSNFLLFAVVFVFGYMLTRLLQRALSTSILPKTKMDIGGQNAVTSGVGYIGVFLAALIAITTAGIDLSGLAIVAGALSVGIGFGLQNIVSNFVSGIILLIERPISEGDWIEAGGHMGTVKDISVRSTRIETFDRSDVIVPNADLVSGAVINYTRGNNVGRVILKIGVAYGSDTRRVAEILQEIAESHPMVLLNPKPFINFAGFGADSLDFEVRLILRDINFGLGVRTEINHLIAERFAKEGIEIPFAQRDIWLRNPEALTGRDGQHPGKEGSSDD